MSEATATSLSVNGWTVTVEALTEPEPNRLEQRPARAATREEARSAVDLLRPDTYFVACPGCGHTVALPVAAGDLTPATPAPIGHWTLRRYEWWCPLCWAGRER